MKKIEVIDYKSPSEWLFLLNYPMYMDAISKANIVHFAGVIKPWEHLLSIFSGLFAFYYNKSVYLKQPLK